VPAHPAPTLAGGSLSVQAISWVIDHSKSKANPFVVLMMIANHAKSDGTGAWPSVRLLAKECRLNERTVQRSMLTLVKLGELRVAKGQGPYGTNLYEIPGVKLPPPGGKLSGEGCQNDGVGVAQVSPKPSLTVSKDNHVDLIQRAIKESERTGTPADDLLKEWRKRRTHASEY
jgi:Helix-turn-helix domain